MIKRSTIVENELAEFDQMTKSDSMNHLPTGTVTFLFTDIEGSTQLAEQYPEAMPGLLARHHDILREAIQAHNGYILRVSGDAFVAAFYTAGEALLAALEAQRGLYREGWDPVPIRVRMGIHTGTAQAVASEEPGDSYAGYLTLTQGQRVMSAAHGGQVLLSGATRELLRGELPEGASLQDMGARRLKGLLNPVQLWQVLAPDLPSEFPPLQTLDATPNNLPTQLNSFVGRERQVAEVKALLTEAHDPRDPARLFTLTGPGGAGKTRLSLQVAAEALEAFRDGAWFVELAPIDDPELVPQAIARAFRVSEGPGKPIREALKDYLREKELLLVLDNFEQVMPATPLVKELLTAAPRVKVLVSSRALLRITGEREYPVPLMRIPDPQELPPLDQLIQYEAVQLFIDRAQAVKADFTVDQENAPAVAEICCRLDGLPLAIELAAARVRLLTPQKMLAQLNNQLKFLTSSMRDLPERQQTLRAAIDWSYDLLAPEEQTLFRRLAVFAGGATLEAAEAVCNADGAVDVFGGIESLIDKSLLRQSEQGGEPRFTMLGIIREYAREKLAEAGELASVNDRLLDFYIPYGEKTDELLYNGGDWAWLEQVEAEIDNLRAALDWGLDQDPDRGIALASNLASFWAYRGHLTEGRSRLQATWARLAALPEAEGETGSRMQAALTHALDSMGLAALVQGDVHAARKALEESVERWRRSGDRRGLAMALSLLGLVDFFLDDTQAAQAVLEESIDIARAFGNLNILCASLSYLGRVIFRLSGDFSAARAPLEEGVRLSRELGDKQRLADTLFNYGSTAYQAGEYGIARRQFQESMTFFAEIGNVHFLNMSRSGLAEVAWREGDTERAISLYRETLIVWRRLGNRGAAARMLECLAFAIAQRGRAGAGGQPGADFSKAARLLGAAEALRTDSGAPMMGAEYAEYEREVAALRGDLDEEAFEAGWQTGRRLSLEQAIQAAL
jgi:predicted ATPase/class 3 adenylate cyclase